MRLKQKSRKVISFSQLCLWLKRVYHFVWIALCNPPLYLPTRYNTKLISWTISASNITVLFNMKPEIKMPLTSARKRQRGAAFEELNQWHLDAVNLLMCRIGSDVGLNYERPHCAHSSDTRGGGSELRWRWRGTKKGGEPLCQVWGGGQEADEKPFKSDGEQR